MHRWKHGFKDKMYQSLLLILTVLTLPHRTLVEARQKTHGADDARPVHNTNFTESDNRVTASPSYINPYRYHFILQAAPCIPSDKLLIVIHSSTKPKYNKRRTLLRTTWLNKALLQEKLGVQVKIVFFLGKANNTIDEHRIRYESEYYGDIVQSDFEDSYEHNTYKAMSYLLWTSKYCSRASLLMKLDDDVLVRTQRLEKLKNHIEKWIASKSALYIGTPIDNAPNRDPRSKWYVSRKIWQADVYPTWFQGLVYFLTPSHTKLLYHLALTTHYMHTDDVFIGIVVSKSITVSTGTTPLHSLSRYTIRTMYEAEVQELKGHWVDGVAIFFQVTSPRAYLEWSYEDLYPTIAKKKPWYQW